MPGGVLKNSEAKGFLNLSYMKIEIEYDGSYPNLCSGNLVVIIDDKRWQFPNWCMRSGGSVTFDSDWSEEVTQGEWDISKWPVGFPEELKADVVNAVNDEIPWGCCGGCV